MKILIDGQTLLTPEINRGIGTYFKNTVESMLENDFTNDFCINSPHGPHLDNLSAWTRNKLCVIDNDAYKTCAAGGRNRRYLSELYSNAINNDIEKLGIDLYWSPNALMHNVFVPTRQTDRCTFAVTIFDLIPLVMEKEYAKHLPSAGFADFKRKLKQIESDFDLYLHISQHTQSDFMRALAVGDKKHIVTPLAAGRTYRPYPFPKMLPVNPYVFYPGGFDPRKNMDRAIEAFAVLQTTYAHDPEIRATALVIVCTIDETSKARMLNRAERLGLHEKIRLMGFVDDLTLVRLYQEARCLFFPSLYEGFGLPLLEGLACGLPVAAANTSSMPEVAGPFAVYFDPCDINDMAQGLYQTLKAPMDYQAKHRRYDYSKEFSWRKTALKTLEAFGCFE
jgi:glycosyltransferase involved in cell wall biosynthesis